MPVVNNTDFITVYYVYLVTGGGIYSVPLTYSSPFYPPAKVTRKTTTGTVYYDNRDEVFAIYSYDIFITMINAAITTIYYQAGLTNPPFFQYNHLTERIEFNKVDGPDLIYFSNNLHPYIGEGMNTIWYVVRPPLITTDVFSIEVEQDVRMQTIVEIDGVDYIKMIQEYKAISSWASINRILFVSHRLPIRREFYPVINSSGILNDSTIAYENMVSMNIICSFLFPSTEAGDYRTNIVYSSTNIDNGDLIDMTNSGALREIDVEVYWSDKYGNVFPITLGPNKQINLRLVFVRK